MENECLQISWTTSISGKSIQYFLLSNACFMFVVGCFLTLRKKKPNTKCSEECTQCLFSIDKEAKK